MRLLAILLFCTSVFLAGGEAEPVSAPTPPPVQPYESNQARLDRLAAFFKINLGMAPLEVASLLGMDCTVEISGSTLTCTWWNNGSWMAVVFYEGKALSKQKGETK